MDKFIIIFIDDILVCSYTMEEYELHLKVVLEKLREKRLYTKFSKYEFWLRNVTFLGHVVSNDGILLDPSKVEVVSQWKQQRNSYVVEFLMVSKILLEVCEWIFEDCNFDDGSYP